MATMIVADDDAPARNPRASRPLDRRPRILVVEDDPAMRSLVADALGRRALEVIVTGSAEEALQQIDRISIETWDRGAIDVVVTDIRMRGGGGLRLGERVFASGWPMALIVMTAFPDDEVRAAVRRMGGTLLEKPFPLDRLVSAVVAVLDATRGG